MEKQQFNLINNFQFYLHTEDQKVYAEYATQDVYVITDYAILKINLYLGVNNNFVNSVEMYDKLLGTLLYSQYDLKKIYVRNIGQYLHDFYLKAYEFLSSRKTLHSDETKLSEKLTISYIQSTSNDYQICHLNEIRTILM